MHDSVSPEVSTQYAMGEHGGPDPNDLHLDMSGGLDSYWNKKVRTILVDKMRLLQQEDELPERSDEYVEELVRDRATRIALVWKRSQSRKTATGELETADDVERRIIKHKDRQLIIARHTTRRRNVSRCRHGCAAALLIDTEIRTAPKGVGAYDQAQRGQPDVGPHQLEVVERGCQQVGCRWHEFRREFNGGRGNRLPREELSLATRYKRISGYD
jgi:hypothetical protein